MGKKGGSGAVSSKHKAKKPLQKSKKSGQFKSLTKFEFCQGVVQNEKKGGGARPKVAVSHKKHPKSVPDEFRNFDERMAATRMKKQVARAAPAPVNAIVTAPSFVMPAPTFQFGAPVQEHAPREVEGFQGFLSAMQEPATAPQKVANRKVRKQRVSVPNNVFAMLDDESEPTARQQQPVVPAPSFLQPATFTFHTNTFGGSAPAGPATKSSGFTSLQRSLMSASAGPSAQSAPVVGVIDPDL